MFAVGDTKWKCLKLDGGHLAPDERDVYQLPAYAGAVLCERMSLIDPWHAGLAEARPSAFRLPAIDARRPPLAVLCIAVHEEP